MSTPTLEEKLANIIDDIANKSNSQGLKGLAFTWGVDYQDQIKQAFKEAGYVNTKSVELQGFTVENLMTGQAWYDRFEKELKKQGSNTLEPRLLHPAEIEENVLEAARRASGVDHE